MRAVYVESFNAEHPAAAVVAGDRPEPESPGDDWTVVTVKAGSGEVIVHGVVNDLQWLGDEALDPRLSLFSERHQGTLAERVAVPVRNLLDKPSSSSSPS